MKLCSRDVFEWRDRRWRLVSIDPAEHAAWIIDLAERHAWPQKVAMSAIADCEREGTPVATTPLDLSMASIKRLEENYALLERMLVAGTDLLDKKRRRAIIARISDETHVCRKTLEKHLRRYWQRGMTKEALLPDYRKCGRRHGGETAGRGRRPSGNYDIYQITVDDYPRFEAAIKAYFADPRRSLASVFSKDLLQLYTFEDGNGVKHVCPFGSRPTLRQFRSYFKKQYDLETSLRKRVGDKEYSKNYKPKLSDTIADCAGAGHRYEIDATIADVTMVHASDPATTIGKATVYFIVDRRSRLIVGFYVGLENPCWETAVEAIISLTECKEALCHKYDIEYDPEDWPADGILPVELLGDNVEMISLDSSRLPRELSVAVANTPSLEAQRKPNVETRFKLITADLRNIAPGYEPPEDRYKRRKQHYDKEAALTLHELTREILEAVIKHNRKPLLSYPLSPNQTARKVEPSPIALWNDEVQQRGCLGRRFEAATVRAALLPRATAKITHEGLLFKNLYYVSGDARLQRAFAKARGKRSSVTVSYDRRSVDCIYVHLPDGMVLATLSDKSHGYDGLSFREAKLIQESAKEQKHGFEQKCLDVSFQSLERRAPGIRKAERRRNELGPLSVQARKANSVAARQDEKRNERMAKAENLKQEARLDPMPVSTPAKVTGLAVNNRKSVNDSAALRPAQLARKRMGA